MKRWPILPLICLFMFTACTLVQETEEAVPYPDTIPALAPTFSIVTWNTAKGQKSSPEKITTFITALSSRLDSPVIALQEATRKIIAIPGRGAHFAKSFHWWGSKTLSGVALVSGTAPTTTYTLSVKRRELGFTTPKMGLAAVYPVTGLDQATHPLLVVTLHGLNFELTARGLTAQMKCIHDLVSTFQGPAVVCGDFNSWSTGRLAIVTQALPGFTEVPTQGGGTGTSRVVNLIGGDADLAIDRIFYRGLLLEGAATIFSTNLSDHHPILAQFTLP